MKKIITLLAILLFTLNNFAQNGINYKALIKDDLGNVIANDLIIVQFQILQGAGMTNVYQETHTPNTDANGIIIINIGEGPVVDNGVFADINWGSDDHFLNVQINTGAGLTDMGTTQFMAVPYALNALSALSSSDNHWKKDGDVVHNTSDNIGIGSDALDAKLAISTVSELNEPHLLLHEESNDYTRMRFQNNNEGNYWTIAAYIAASAQNDRLNFYNQTNGDLMTLTGDGQVGIGVGISPKTGFHVGNMKRVLFGTDTLGPGDKLMFLPKRHAFRVGTISTGAASVYWNNQTYFDDFHQENMNYIGLYSFASGLDTRAQGYGATATGRDTEATNDYAFASGYFTDADGRNSTAMGYNTDASAIYSVAIGNTVRAQSYGSTAIGSYNVGGGDADTWTGSDPLFEIGNGTTPSTRSNAMTVLKNGRVGIGTTSPSQELHVVGTIRVGSFEEISDGGGATLSFNSDLVPTINDAFNLGNSNFRWDNVFATNGTISTSDRRNKDNIRGLSYGLAEIMQLKPVSFTWKKDAASGRKLGLLAQDLQKVIKEVVVDTEWQTDEKTGRRTAVPMERLGVYYSDLIPVLIKATQEQQEIIDNQNKKISILTTELTALKSLDNRVKQLEALLKNTQ